MVDFTYPFSLNSSELIVPHLNIREADQSILILPVTNPADTLTTLNVTGTTASVSQREFLVNIGLVSDKGAGSSNPQMGKLPLFAGIDAHAGTGDVWSLYSAVGMLPGSGNYNCTGYEVDVNNQNTSRGYTGNLNIDLSAPIVYGIQITGSGTQTSTSALLISSQSGVGQPDQWARGVVNIGRMTVCGYQDVVSAPIGFQFDGNYSIAALNFTSVYGNQGANTPTVMLIKNGQQIAWQANPSTTTISDHADVFNNRYVGVGSAGVFTGAGCYPISSGLNLGSPSNAWGTIYATSGVVNPSDLSLKSDVQPLQAASQTIQAITPISFRWKDASTDTNLHYGFDAKEIKDNMPSDYGGYIDAEGVGHIVKDELIAVLWQSNRELLQRIEALENPSSK